MASLIPSSLVLCHFAIKTTRYYNLTAHSVGPFAFYPSVLMCQSVHGCLNCTGWICVCMPPRMIYKAERVCVVAHSLEYNKTVVYVQTASVHCQGERHLVLGQCGGTMGGNTTNHLFLTAGDAGTDEACAIGYTTAFCNKSIKSPLPVYENGPWQGHAIHFNKDCRLGVR